MGRASLHNLKTNDPDYLIPDVVKRANNAQMTRLLREHILINNPGPDYALPDGSTSADKHATLLFPLAGLSPHCLNYIIKYVAKVAVDTHTTFIDNTSSVAYMPNNKVTVPTARLIKGSPSELYILNPLPLMPLYRCMKAMTSFQVILVNGRTMFVLKAQQDVKTFLKILSVLDIKTDIRNS